MRAAESVPSSCDGNARLLAGVAPGFYAGCVMDDCRPARQVLKSTDDRTGAWVEIHRGRTRFRQRPFVRDRFLIGAGSNCDLQLGGTGIPILHSLIVLEDGQPRIEAVVASPALVVAGRPVRESRLAAGELVEIGSFALVVHRGSTPGHVADLTAPLEISSLLALDQNDAAIAANLSALSASQLIAGIELELGAVGATESSSQEGFAALIEAVQAAASTTGVLSKTSLDALALQLEGLAAQMAADSRRLGQRERALAAQSERVLEMQERVIAECSRLLNEVGELEAAPRSRLRLSA